MLGIRSGGAIACLCALLLAATAQARPQAPLSHQGRWITDAQGRVVILHGVNMVSKRPPYAPDATGFGADDAAFLIRNGFNTVRLGLIYGAVEPNPGAYDDAYLNRIAATEQLLADHHIFSQLDFHQDLYNERFQGEGWPDWGVQDDGLPAAPQTGFPGNYVAMPALNRAFDHFWANDPGPGGVSLQDRYAAAFRHVAQRFAGRDHTIGYDLLNEPWPGSPWPSCANNLGCPAFDTMTMAPFYERVIDRIREVETQKLIWYEPNVVFNFGADSSIPDMGDPNTGFSFHVYCLAGAFALGGFPPTACETFDDLVFENAGKQATETGDALLLSEFGATDDLDVIRRNIASAEREMVSWQYWHYCACEDPTTQGPGATQALVIDPTKAPSGDNVRAQKLDVLARAFPQSTAGTPLSYSYDEGDAVFRFSHTTQRAGGGSFTAVTRPGGRLSARTPQSEIFLPGSDYPNGYVVDLANAAIVSRPNARVLRVAACPGKRRVTLTVRRAGRGSTGGPDCAVAGVIRPKLRVRVRPRRVLAGERACFRIRVRTQGTRVRGASVRLGRKGRRTGRRGRTTICRRFETPGAKLARATKLGFRPGRGTVLVLPR